MPFLSHPLSLPEVLSGWLLRVSSSSITRHRGRRGGGSAVGGVGQSRKVNEPEWQQRRKSAFHSACKSDRHGKDEECHDKDEECHDGDNDGDNDGEVKPHSGSCCRGLFLTVMNKIKLERTTRGVKIRSLMTEVKIVIALLLPEPSASRACESFIWQNPSSH